MVFKCILNFSAILHYTLFLYKNFLNQFYRKVEAKIWRTDLGTRLRKEYIFLTSFNFEYIGNWELLLMYHERALWFSDFNLGTDLNLQRLIILEQPRNSNKIETHFYEHFNWDLLKKCQPPKINVYIYKVKEMCVCFRSADTDNRIVCFNISLNLNVYNNI